MIVQSLPGWRLFKVREEVEKISRNLGAMEPNTETQPWGRWMWCSVLMMALTPSYSCSVGARVQSQEENLSPSREHPFLTHSIGSSGACMSQLCTQE